MFEDSKDRAARIEAKKWDLFQKYEDKLDLEIQYIDLLTIQSIFGKKRVRLSGSQIQIRHNGKWWDSSRMTLRGAIESMW